MKCISYFGSWKYSLKWFSCMTRVSFGSLVLWSPHEDHSRFAKGVWLADFAQCLLPPRGDSYLYMSIRRRSWYSAKGYTPSCFVRLICLLIMGHPSESFLTYFRCSACVEKNYDLHSWEIRPTFQRPNILMSLSKKEKLLKLGVKAFFTDLGGTQRQWGRARKLQ